MARLAGIAAFDERVQWTGAGPEPETIPMPTEWDQISYTYDPAGRRIEKKYDTTTVVKYVDPCPGASVANWHMLLG